MTIQEAIDAIRDELPEGSYFSVQTDYSSYNDKGEALKFNVFARVGIAGDMLACCCRSNLATAVNELVAMIRSKLAPASGTVAELSEQVAAIGMGASK